MKILRKADVKMNSRQDKYSDRIQARAARKTAKDTTLLHKQHKRGNGFCGICFRYVVGGMFQIKFLM